MAAAIYTRLEATAQRLIAKYGKPAEILRVTTSGTAHDPTVNEASHGIILVETGYSITNRTDSLIQTGDKVGIISTDADVEPRKTDKLRFPDGEVWTLEDVQPLNPGGLLLLTEFVARR